MNSARDRLKNLPATTENLERLKKLRALTLRSTERTRKGLTERYFKWSRNAVGFIVDALKGVLWSKQREICESILVHRRTAVRSCHDVGKTALAARISAWWIAVHPPGEAFVVTLAPTGHQVKALLWRELARVQRAAGLPGRMNQTEWYLGDELVAFGRSPKDTDPTAIQGIHARFVLVVFDEACGIANALWDAADSLIANEDSRMLAIGNPDDPNTQFGVVCKPGSGWNTIGISAFESPNFTGEEIPDWLRPLLVSRIWVEEKRKSWGETSPLYQSKILGLFPEQSSDSLIPLTAIYAAKERELEQGEPNDLGVDVARFGGDHTVIMHRRGGVFRRLSKDHNRDLMYVVGLVVRAIKDTDAKRVKIDDAGLGGGVTDRLNELKREGTIPDDVQVIPINVGEGAQEQDEQDKRDDTERGPDERYKNLKAELNWQVRDLFLNGQISLIEDKPGDMDDLMSQAGQIKYDYTSKGLIIMEAKKMMKKRTKGVSPDDWDALVLAAAEVEVDSTLEHWIKAFG